MVEQTTDPYRIEQFSLEPAQFAELAGLIKTAFIHDSQAEGGTIAFDEETFGFIFGSPSAPRDLFVRVIHEPTGDLVGFLGGIPRDFSIDGEVEVPDRVEVIRRVDGLGTRQSRSTKGHTRDCRRRQLWADAWVRWPSPCAGFCAK